MKITLINPPYLFSERDTMSLPQCLGLRYISAYLKKYGGHHVDIIDALLHGYSNVRNYPNGCIVGLTNDEIISRIPEDTNLIGISVPFSTLAAIAHNLIESIKNVFTETTLIMGGVYPSSQPKLALTSKADYIVVGEGENALLRIAAGQSYKSIKGVYSHADRKNKTFPPTDLIKNLDSIPFPDHSFPSIKDYFVFSPRKSKRAGTASIITSRGCPFACEFCSIHPIYGKKWRSRSSDNVIEELELLSKEFDIKYIEFEDDNFTLDKKRTVDILSGIVKLNESGHDIKWRAPNGVRIDTLDDDNVVSLIKRSNCETIFLGLEHGDPEMLDIMNKKLKLGTAYRVIKRLVEHRIKKIVLFIIVGYPGETDRRFNNSLAYLKNIKKLGGNIKLNVNIAQPYPGTKLLKRCLSNGYILNKNIDNFLLRKEAIYTGRDVQMTTPDFDALKVLKRKQILIDCFSQKSDAITPNTIASNAITSNAITSEKGLLQMIRTKFTGKRI